MRSITTGQIIEAVKDACIKANLHLPEDVLQALEKAYAAETAPGAREVLRQLLENSARAVESGVPLCQDTGLAILFAEIGQDIHIEGDFAEAVNEGVRQGYAQGLLRKSVCHPFTRANTGDNTPAIIHSSVVPGSGLKFSLLAKGGGSENMSRVTMLAPAEGWNGIKKFVLQRVAESGSNPCPPVIVGLGIGGSFDTAPIMAKRALLRPLDEANPDPDLDAKEQELLDAINSLGIGPMGLGGKTTCLGVRINMAPCHIASLPLAVNIQCHSARHMEFEI